MSAETLLAFAGTCFLIEVTPGPNMAYLAVLSAGSGRRAGFAATAGIALGLLAVGSAAAFGLASLIAGSPLAYEALRWGGVAYLLWLAWDGWRDAETSAVETEAPVADIRYFRRGLVTNLLNPKAAVFYVAVLPSFVDAGAPVLRQTLVLSVVYVAIATAIHAGIVALAGIARPFLEDPARNRVLRRTLSLALAAIALWFAYSTRR
ncbi:LysE family translocator [Methylobacterium sp. Leaf466]|uniref:LysE family translocator n=1 Tax=Methylobacterium sp. Leaf466 TaxID=1736386 RepID=UPI000701AEE9|nr:LysE family translocator [Methylobacterium sp. Leaf466]KQT88743.1 lysine transporter LysE [Methylobacterium sp. Leaf466]